MATAEERFKGPRAPKAPAPKEPTAPKGSVAAMTKEAKKVGKKSLANTGTGDLMFEIEIGGNPNLKRTFGLPGDVLWGQRDGAYFPMNMDWTGGKNFTQKYFQKMFNTGKKATKAVTPPGLPDKYGIIDGPSGQAYAGDFWLKPLDLNAYGQQAQLIQNLHDAIKNDWNFKITYKGEDVTQDYLSGKKGQYGDKANKYTKDTIAKGSTKLSPIGETKLVKPAGDELNKKEGKSMTIGFNRLSDKFNKPKDAAINPISSKILRMK